VQSSYLCSKEFLLLWLVELWWKDLLQNNLKKMRKIAQASSVTQFIFVGAKTQAFQTLGCWVTSTPTHYSANVHEFSVFNDFDMCFSTQQGP
jgi:hypothetical protein